MKPADSALPARAVVLVLTRGLSAFGSGMTQFALNVWVFQQTGSYGVFALLTMLSTLPNLLMSPLSGMVVDHGPKRPLLLACELLPLTAVVLAAACHRAAGLGVAGVAATVLVLALTSNLRWTLMGATIPRLVPRAALGRINGLQQGVGGFGDIAAPLLGAGALQAFGFEPVLMFDAASSLVAACGVLALGRHALAAAPAPRQRAGFWSDARFGLDWIRQNPDMWRLLRFVTLYNIAGAAFMATFVPYVLIRSSGGMLSLALALEGGGAFACGLALAARRGRAAGAGGVLLGATLFGALLVAWGLVRHPVLLAAGAGCAGVLTSLIVASLQTAWQAAVPSAIQGRVFAARRMVSFTLVPLVAAASAPAARHLFAPLLAGAPFLERTWGSGPGAALGMMLSCIGTVLLLGCLAVLARGGLEAASAPAGQGLAG